MERVRAVYLVERQDHRKNRWLGRDLSMLCVDWELAMAALRQIFDHFHDDKPERRMFLVYSLWCRYLYASLTVFYRRKVVL